MADARKRASKLDMEEYSRKAEKYVAEKDFSTQANEEMRLYNLTMKVNRLELLKAEIGLELIAMTDDVEKLLEKGLDERTIEEFKRQAGILGMSVGNPKTAAKSIVNASFHNATFSERIWANQTVLKNEISKLLQKGMIQGRNPKELARELRKTCASSKYDSERLMRTEMARVQIEAQKLSYEENGYDEYEYICCHKGDACSACKALDGEHFKTKKMMPGENAPPMHPNCHCSTAAHIDDKEYDDWLSGYKDHGMSFKEWREQAGKINDEIKNREYKVLSLEEFKKMHHTVSKEERKILYGRTHMSGYINSSNARKLNSLLRDGEELPDSYRKIADTMSDVIKKNTIPEDIITTRFVADDALEYISGIAYPKPPGLLSGKDELKKYWDEIANLKNVIPSGRVYTEKGFLSTSGVPDKNVFKDRRIQLNIKVPKGSNCYITTNYKESEIIFDRNSKLEIIGVRVENNGTAQVKVIIDCIMR